jgi:predicted glycosyltransferase
MKILVEILHPAHVHFFKNAIRSWLHEGHTVIITGRDKDCALSLTRALGHHERLRFANLSKKSSFSLLLAVEFLLRLLRLNALIRADRPDLMIGIMGVTIAPLGKVWGIKTMVFYDTEVASLTNRFAFRLATRVGVPDCFQARVGANAIRYPGYHELAYLHPSVFTPDPGVLNLLQVKPGERFFILRWVSLNSSHDLSTKGLTPRQKIELSGVLRKHGKVFISSEGPLPAELQDFKLSLDPSRFLDLLAHASLVVGESATVSSEAAMLGVPSIYVSNSKRGYTDELELRYGLVKMVSPERFDELRGLIEAWVQDETMGARMRQKRDQMLKEKLPVNEVILQQVRELMR